MVKGGRKQDRKRNRKPNRKTKIRNLQFYLKDEMEVFLLLQEFSLFSFVWCGFSIFLLSCFFDLNFNSASKDIF